MDQYKTRQNPTGSLHIVGTGIQTGLDTSIAARRLIETADNVLYLLADPVSEAWVKKRNSSAETLADCYQDGQRRIYAYLAMVDRILNYVRQGKHVTVVSYGHPGVFCFPAHEAIRISREEGYSASILPAISSEDCLFADLGVDPGKHGCQSFECTDFLIRKRKFDPTSSLILWQIGVIGDSTYPLSKIKKKEYNKRGLGVLVEYLKQFYEPLHEVIVYQASPFPIVEPVVQRTSLDKLAEARIIPISTLYVPPKPSQQFDIDMVNRLGIKGL